MTPGAWIVAVLAVIGIVLYEQSTSGDGAGAGDDLVDALLSGITKAENVATSHNNPGGICGSYDSSGNCLGPKTFDTLEDGEAAARALITKILANNPLMTLGQFVRKWTGVGSGASYDNYVNTLGDATGLDSGDQLNSDGDATDDSGD